MLGVIALPALGFSGTSTETLRDALQAELDTLAKLHPTFALSLGWTSEAHGSFGLAAGSVTIDGTSRPTRPADKFLFGSGTKPLTAVAVLRLAQAAG